MAACVFYVLAAGIFGFSNTFVYISIAVILGQGAVLLLFKWSCPLTIIAKRYTDDRKDNFDIFIPETLARHNKTIFTTLFLIGLFLIVARALLED